MTIAAKICGITTPEALEAAIAGGADYIGLVFFAKSPRHLEIARARGLAELARGRVKIVALTVDADDEALREIVDTIAPDALQLHGDETPERVEDIKKTFATPVIKAIPVSVAADLEQAHAYLDVADVILFDAKATAEADRPGGNGRTFDWTVLDGVSDRVSFMLSGGLTPDNVAAAIMQTHPSAVDVSSGVETAPGVKDADQIRRFLKAAKSGKPA